MTNERDTKELDSRVAETYRELPDLRAPEHLNETILRLATSNSPEKSHSLFAAWLKPVTLAATIALSVAIVLELSDVPTTAVESPAESIREDQTTTVDVRVLEELVLEDADLSKSEAKGRISSFAASPAALPAARKRATDRPDSNQSAAACDARARQSADSWLECIENLRESGAIQDADREYEAFARENPAAAMRPESEPNK